MAINRWYSGTTDYDEYHDNHQGLDFIGDRGLWVVAMHPGICGHINNSDDGTPKGVSVHNSTIKMLSSTGHHDDILVSKDDKIFRGQIVGTNGDTGTQNLHIHTNLLNAELEDWTTYEGWYLALDPFRDTMELHSQIRKTDGSKYGSPQAFEVGSPGYWTKNNDPQTAL